VKKEHNIVRA